MIKRKKKDKHTINRGTLTNYKPEVNSDALER